MPLWLKKTYSAYALTLFALLIAGALLPYLAVRLLVPYRKKIRWIYRINAVVMHLWSPLTGMRFESVHADSVRKPGPFIAIGNHYSLLDMFACAHSLAIPGKPLVKRELLGVPILGWLFRMAAIPVDRGDAACRRASLERMEAELKQGVSLLIFPEGTRNRSEDPLGPFRDGAFRLSAATNTPVVPVLLLGARSLSHTDKLVFRPGKIVLHYLDPMHPADYGNDAGRLKQACYTAMETGLRQWDPYYQTK